MNGTADSNSKTYGVGYGLRLFIVAASYALLSSAILQFFASDKTVSLFWPSSGLALACLLLGGIRYWPGIFVGTFFTVYYNGAGHFVPIAVSIAVGNTLEPVIACWLLQGVCKVKSIFKGSGHYYCFIFCCAIAAVISAIGGEGSLWFFGYHKDDQVLSSLLFWWQGNMLGMILVTPLILAWQEDFEWNFSLLFIARAALCFVLSFLCGQIVFLGWFESYFGQFANPFWMFLFLSWSAARFGYRGVLLLLLLMTIQGMVGIVHRFPAFSGNEQQLALLNFWVFMMIASMVGIRIALAVRLRNQTTQELHESEERWKFALEGSGDGVWDWDMESDKVHLSAYFMRMYDYGGNSVEATPGGWSELVHPEDMPQVLQDFDAHIEGKTPFYQNEHRVRCKDGHYKWILDRGMIVRYSAKGKPLRMVGTHSDISDRKEAEVRLLEANTLLEQRVAERTQELNAARQKAEEATQIKTDFLANMSHEIRTPIGNIINMSNVILGSTLENSQRDYLEKIRISGNHLLELVDDVLDYSKLETGKIQLENTDFYIDNLMQEVVALQSEQLKEKSLKVMLDVDSRIEKRLRGDALRLRQILLNYLNNAIKFSERGDIKIRCFIISSTDKNYLLRFEVIDQGIGILPAMQQKIFAAFQQADMSIRRKFGGSGLGLAISRRLAAIMGGEVGFESQPNKGSLFWFTATLAKSSVPADIVIADETQTASKNLTVQRLQGVRVLLVEDDRFNQQVAQELLELAGATVVTAVNGLEALQRMHETTFDCVLMDIQMPVLDGLEAIRQIRADVNLQDNLVIAMTANAWGDDQVRCFQAGADDFMGKPLEPWKLVQGVAGWVLCNRSNPLEITALLEAFDNDAKKTIDQVSYLLKAAHGLVGKLQEAAELQDTEALGELAKTLRQSALAMRANTLVLVCEYLIKAQEQTKPVGLLNCVRQIRRILERITQQLQLKG